jgi:hypothetical protein
MNKLQNDIAEVFNSGVCAVATFQCFMDRDIEYYEEGQLVLAALNNKGIECKLEDHHGGEGEGEDYWTVWQFTRQGEEAVYVEFQGYYYSYDGSTFQEWFFVEPREVLVTQYFRI